MKTRATFLTIIGAIMLLLLSGAVFSGEDEQTGFEFPHAVHVEGEGLECADCHGAATESTTGADNLMPNRDMCLDCHDAEDLSDFANMPQVTEYSVLFSHKLHAEAGQECADCHGMVAAKEEVLPLDLPGMVDCMDCHEQKLVVNTCESCHLPSEDLRPVTHTLDFIHNHAILARTSTIQKSSGMDCVSCHSQNFCQDCHEGENVDRLTHPLNYEFTHALDAANKMNNCSSCHTNRQFCIDCHRDNNVLPHNHGAGWVNNIPNNGGLHALEAINDLEACASCHESNAQTVCAPCHGN